MTARGPSMALCVCGCGRRVSAKRNRWATPQCVPRALRSAAATKARRFYSYRRRAITFRSELLRLLGGGGAITREALLDTFQVIYDKGYAAGQHRRLRDARREQRAA